MMYRTLRLLPAVLSVLALVACSGNGDSTAQPTETVTPGGRNGGLLEDFFGSSGSGGGTSSSGIAVNRFLWRASLDTISFLPLNTADPFGGVIITDWYSPPKSPDERFKVTVYILDRQLRADGLRVAVFRQTRDTKYGWVEAKVDEKTGRGLENAILKRARQMRIRVKER